MIDLEEAPPAEPAPSPSLPPGGAVEPPFEASGDVGRRRASGGRSLAQLWLVRFGGVAAAFGGCALAIELDGNYVFHTLFVSAFLIVMSLAWFGLVASHGLGLVGRFLAVVGGGVAKNEAEAEQLRAMARRGRRLSYTGGVFAALAGAIHVMSVLDQPALIGPGAAVALIGPVYGLLLAELFFGAAENWVRVAPEAV